MNHHLKNLLRFAQEHGYTAIINGALVTVSDSDGSISTDSIIALRRWMGY